MRDSKQPERLRGKLRRTMRPPDWATAAGGLAVGRRGLAPMCLHDLGRDGEADPFAAAVAVARFGHSIEGLENALQVGRRDARPAIANRHHQMRSGRARPRPPPGLLRAVAHGIAQHVLDGAAHQFAVAVDGHRWPWPRTLILQFFTAPSKFASRTSFLDHLIELEGFARELSIGAMQARELQDLADERSSRSISRSSRSSWRPGRRRAGAPARARRACAPTESAVREKCRAIAGSLRRDWRATDRPWRRSPAPAPQARPCGLPVPRSPETACAHVEILAGQRPRARLDAANRRSEVLAPATSW